MEMEMDMEMEIEMETLKQVVYGPVLRKNIQKKIQNQTSLVSS